MGPFQCYRALGTFLSLETKDNLKELILLYVPQGIVQFGGRGLNVEQNRSRLMIAIKITDISTDCLAWISICIKDLHSYLLTIIIAKIE